MEFKRYQSGRLSHIKLEQSCELQGITCLKTYIFMVILTSLFCVSLSFSSSRKGINKITWKTVQQFSVLFF